MILNIYIFLISYFVAALSPSIIISRKILGIDIRELGSNNAGTTNSIRTMGKKVGAVVFILDILKVVISYLIILLTSKLFNHDLTSFDKTLYMLASVIGHTYPIYYGFKGGKGVAVFLMSSLLVDTKMAAICIGFGVIIILIFRMVSLGSILGSVLMVILTLFGLTNYSFIIVLITVIVIIYNHRENVKRIIAGRENKLF